jgi:hypothetical protein
MPGAQKFGCRGRMSRTRRMPAVILLAEVG